MSTEATEISEDVEAEPAVVVDSSQIEVPVTCASRGA